MFGLSSLAIIASAALTLTSAAPAAEASPAPYSPKIYIAASGPGVGIYAGSGTRDPKLSVNGPALAIFDNFNSAEVATETFLTAVQYPDGTVKGGITASSHLCPIVCTLSSHAYQDQDVTFVIQAVKGNEVPFGQVAGTGNTLSCDF